MKKSYACFYLLLLLSCNASQKKQPLSIKGDWSSAAMKRGFRNIPFLFSFEDTLCKAENVYGPFTKYKIKDSFLFIESDTVLSAERLPIVYKIQKLTGDSLVLQKRNYQTVIALGRMKKRNESIPERLFFSSSGCYGSCPVMKLEIDSNRNILFYGKFFTDLTGGYSGKIPELLYKELCKKIQQLDLAELKERYEAGWTDDETLSVVIISGNNRISASVYGFDKEPPSLRILLNYLQLLYKRVSMAKNDSVSEQYFEKQPF